MNRPKTEIKKEVIKKDLATQTVTWTSEQRPGREFLKVGYGLSTSPYHVILAIDLNYIKRRI